MSQGKSQGNYLLLGEIQTFTIDSGFGASAPASGTCYTVTVTIDYTTEYGIDLTEVGTITGWSS